jgi:multiple sugar transport system ATP-binding protein
MAKLVLDRVTKKFGSVVAVNDLSLEVADGEFLVLLGPSGAGKTTTLKLISGVEHSDDGLIYIGDKLVNALEPPQRNVAMAFETYALYPNFNVYENIAFPLKAPGRKISKQDIDRKVRSVAELLGITPLLERHVGALSGGQRQRVSLGRAMVRDPEILLLDEPIAHLDAKLRHRMRTEFKALEREIHTTTIYVTHDYLEALSLADRVVVLNLGKLQQVGTTDDVFNHPVNVFVATQLGQPKINLIKSTVSNNGGKLQFDSTDAGAICLDVPDKLKDAVLKANAKEFLVGIRPLYMDVVDVVDNQAGRANVIDATVYVYERLGTKGVLTASTGSQSLDVITPIEMDFRIDEPVKLAVQVDNLIVFDAASEQNILAM